MCRRQNYSQGTSSRAHKVVTHIRRLGVTVG